LMAVKIWVFLAVRGVQLLCSQSPSPTFNAQVDVMALPYGAHASGSLAPDHHRSAQPGE
jgi:hypothetical protein